MVVPESATKYQVKVTLPTRSSVVVVEILNASVLYVGNAILNSSLHAGDSKDEVFVCALSG